ncbi:hypothetical protein [Thermoflexibacter ruber]|uniref:Uncharacterized protein n=1 Tax=Thermoflexibacter ruber TaxID=1003 RepID=A0A1I2K0Q3_9BACT|nr:hypothetical protein [Thermoflexibacter ruber]SFF60424.1 hypothetical protein SAMN04488541_10786 [Thermoflexibacter ruber]
MSTKFNLKITSKEASWGIFIMIDADSIITDLPYSLDTIRISDEVYLHIDTNINLYEHELKLFVKAIMDNLNHILVYNRQGHRLIIKINNVIFPITDYQSEGFYYAMEGWLGLNFGFESKPVIYSFDKLQNKFIFEIPE